jgi:hypothetical protein
MINELIPYEELGLTKSRLDIINNFVYYKKQVETFETELKEKFKELVENEVIPVNSVDLGGVILSYKKAYTTKRVDTDKLKEDGLYDNYLKKSEVKSSVSMSVKKED